MYSEREIFARGGQGRVLLWGFESPLLLVGMKYMQKLMLRRFNKLIADKDLLMVIVLCVGFFSLKLLSINDVPGTSDENWYFYAGHLITKGLLPYKDFFIAHLPVQISLYALIIKIFGFKIWIFRLFQLLINLVTAFLLYNLVGGKSGKKIGVLGVGFYLFSLVVLSSAGYSTGVHEATLFLVLSWYLLFKSSKFAGLAFFVGVLFRRYIFPVGVGFVVYQVWRKKYRSAIEFIIYSLVPYLIVNLILYVFFGESYLTPAWRYHAMKIDTTSTFEIYSEFMINNIFMNIFSFAGGFVVIRDIFKGKRRRSAVDKVRSNFLDLGGVAVAALMFQYIFFRYFSNVYLMYLVTLIPFLAILSSIALTKYIPMNSRRFATMLIVALSLLNSVLYKMNIGWTYKIVGFDKIVEEVKLVTDEDDKLFGSYVVTPIIALESNREIINNEADTNYQRFLTGLLSIDEATKLATESAIFFQFADSKGDLTYSCGRVVALNPAHVDQKVITENCRLHRSYPIEWLGYKELYMWRCAS